MSGRYSVGRFFTENAVIIIFLGITIAAIPPSGLSIPYILQEMITRLGRNSFLVLALLLPIYAGMGLNFGMTLGAMSGQIGLIMAINWNVVGVEGLLFAALLGTPISVFMGWVCGSVLNRAKGREMVTGYILAFFINGIYQFVVLYLMGSVFPIRNPAILLSRGYGIRNTLNLEIVRQSLDSLWAMKIGGLVIPAATFLVIASLCLFIVWFKKTKLGQDMRAVGYDMTVAEASGIKVDRTRIIAIMILHGAGLLRADHLPSEYGQRGHLQRPRPDELLRRRCHSRRRRLGEEGVDRERFHRRRAPPRALRRFASRRSESVRFGHDRRILQAVHRLRRHRPVPGPLRLAGEA